MFFNLSVYDAAQRRRGEARLQLDWSLKKWMIVEDKQRIWQRVGYSRKGSFEIKHWSVIWLWDRGHNTVIFKDAPLFKFDLRHVHIPGDARIFDPKDKLFKEGNIRWTTDTSVTPPLNALRKKAQQELNKILPAPYGGDNWRRNPFHSLKANAKSGYTNCVEFPAYLGHLLGDSRFPRGYPPVGTKGWTEAASATKPPLPGDVFILCKTAKRDQTTAHVGVIYDTSWNNSGGLIWRTGDWGQGTDSWSGAFVNRTYNPKAGTLTGDAKNPRPPRAIKGWVDLDKYFAKS